MFTTITTALFTTDHLFEFSNWMVIWPDTPFSRLFPLVHRFWIIQSWIVLKCFCIIVKPSFGSKCQTFFDTSPQWHNQSVVNEFWMMSISSCDISLPLSFPSLLFLLIPLIIHRLTCWFVTSYMMERKQTVVGHLYFPGQSLPFSGCPIIRSCVVSNRIIDWQLTTGHMVNHYLPLLHLIAIDQQFCPDSCCCCRCRRWFTRLCIVPKPLNIEST